MANYFRVVNGAHKEGGKIYRPEDGVFKSKSDLSKHNSRQSKKFERVEPTEKQIRRLEGIQDEAPVEEVVEDSPEFTEEELNELTIPVLKQIADEKAIAVSSGANKAEIIESILEATS